MDPWLIAAGVVAAAAALVAVFVALERRRRRAWTALAEALGLAPDPGRPPLRGYPVLVGRVGGVDVRLTTYETSSPDDATRWTAVSAAAGSLPPHAHLRVTRRGLGTRLLTALTGEDEVPTGDEEFDRAYLVRGNAAYARRALDSRTRAALGALAPFDELRVGRASDVAAELGRLRRFLRAADRLAAEKAAEALAHAPPTVTLVWVRTLHDAERLRTALATLARLAQDLPR